MKVGIAVVVIVGVAAIAVAQASRSVWDGVYTQAQAERGEAFYRQECSRCHGDTLGGGEEAPPLVGAPFMANWNGTTLGDLLDRIRVTMPSDSPGKLSRQQTVDVLAHVLRVNRFPAGKTELARQTEFLKQIQFEATKH